MIRFLTRNRIIIAVSLLALIIVVFSLKAFFSREVPVNTGAQFLTSPIDTVVRIEGTETKPNSKGIVKLEPGIYKIEFSREHFDSQTQEVIVVENQIKEVLALLMPEHNNPEGEAVLRRLGEQENRELIVYRLTLQREQEIRETNPIISYLPAVTADFRVDYGEPDEEGRVRMIITTDVASQRAIALDWIKSKGFNPDELNIAYRFYDDL